MHLLQKHQACAQCALQGLAVGSDCRRIIANVITQIKAIEGWLRMPACAGGADRVHPRWSGP